MAKRRERTIDLDRLVELLQVHLTPAICRAAFGRVRITERQRAWTLYALVRFWIAIVLHAPKALSQALAEARDDPESVFPAVPATPEAFFQRCRDLRPAFFTEVFRDFTARLLAAVPPRYTAELAPVRERFTALVVLDGSRLAAIARRLKLRWNERAVILPGCLLGVYDLGHGLCRALTFTPDAAASELTRAVAVVDTLAPNTLVLGDRLYCTAAFFAALQRHQCWGLVRRSRPLRLRKQRRLCKRKRWGGCLEDWEVQAGSGARVPAQRLRYIRWRGHGIRDEVLTNVLDPQRLPAEDAIALYPYRWGVERMFFDLKEVLNLNRLYAANPNAVAMQVYAAAMVYNGLRVAQSDAAAQVQVVPEAISPAKFFPKVAATFYLTLLEQRWERALRRRGGRVHPRVFRRRHRARFQTVQVERRSDHRRRRRFCQARGRWKSIGHVRGGKRFIRELS
jgi:Transposase DDE domain